MVAGRRRVFARAAAGMAVLAAMAGGCSNAALPASLAPGQTPPPLTPTVTPAAVPVLGTLTLGVFPATQGGADALAVCEDWAGLRGQYIARVLAGDTPFQMELWFSSAAWQPALSANGPLQANPAYGGISVALGMATIGQTAGVTEAKRLDAACAAADLAALSRRCLGPGMAADAERAVNTFASASSMSRSEAVARLPAHPREASPPVPGEALFTRLSAM